MATNIAPPKWAQISELAKELGAKADTVRKWLERGAVPGDWKVRIFERSSGAISFADMEIREEKAA